MANKNASDLISSVYVARKTILELLEIQGYNTEDYKLFSILEVHNMFQTDQLNMLVEKENQTVYVIFNIVKSLKNANLREYIDRLFYIEELLTKNDTLYIIIKDEVNDTINNLVKQIWEEEGIFIIVQSLKRLKFNVLQHSYIPEHRILSPEEVLKLKERYNIMDDTQLPEISRFDPVSKAIGIRPGQICEIKRPSKTAIVAPYYRLCL
jgi:DNA-directed RNA polymerase subunit H (RpoH/RPB5)